LGKLLFLTVKIRVIRG